MPTWLALLDPVSKLLDRLIPDPQARAQAELELHKEDNAVYLQQLQAVAQSDANQTQVNVAEAQSGSAFARNWRPFIGWVCGAAYAYHFVIQQFLAFAFAAFGHPVDLPDLDIQELAAILISMLGLGTLRTTEKIKGVTK